MLERNGNGPGETGSYCDDGIWKDIDEVSSRGTQGREMPVDFALCAGYLDLAIVRRDIGRD